MKHHYTVIYEKVRKSWRAFVPEMPGCTATAETLHQAKFQIERAIRSDLADRRILSGEPSSELTICP